MTVIELHALQAQVDMAKKVAVIEEHLSTIAINLDRIATEMEVRNRRKAKKHQRWAADITHPWNSDNPVLSE